MRRLVPDQRQSDVEKLVDATCPLQIGRFIQRFRDGGHGSHIHDHVVADGLPDHGAGQTVNHDALIAQPVDGFRIRPAKQRQNGIEHTVVGVINGGENGADDDDGENVGNIEHHAKEVLPLDLFAGQNGCKNDGQRHGDHTDNYDQKQRIFHGLQELHIPEEFGEVFKAYKRAPGRKAAPFVQGHAEDIEGRQNHEDKEQKHRRQHAHRDEPASPLLLIQSVSSSQGPDR